MWSVMRRLSLFDFYRTVDFIYIDFNLLPHMEKLPYSLFFAAFRTFPFGYYGYFKLIIISDVANRYDLCYDKYIKNGEVLYGYNSK